MIDFPTQDQLVDLIQQESGRCVSLMLRTHMSGRETNQNPIRFKNLINEAIEQAQDVEDDTLKRLKSLADLERDFDFWQHQQAGLALYVCDGFEERIRLGHAPDEVVHMSDHFFVRPLAGHACRMLSVRVLALSWKSARTFESDGHHCYELTEGAFPVSFEELVTLRDPEEQLQYSSHGARGQSNATQVAMYHGHGEGEDKIEADRDQYLSRIGDLVEKSLYNARHPLIVLATQEVAGHFAAASSIDVADVIHASPDGLDDQAIMEKINSAAHEMVSRSRSELGDRLGSALANDAGSADVIEIVKQAASGRIETLLLGSGGGVRGRFDRDQLQASRDEDSSLDLINVAVRDTLLAGGSVVDMSDDNFVHDVAAIYRY